jgi:hypothetical protein
MVLHSSEPLRKLDLDFTAGRPYVRSLGGKVAREGSLGSETPSTSLL